MGNLQSSPSSSTSEEKYDVFLSFRGEDTRDGFTNNLYEALEGKKIKTFMDDQLSKGDRISEALLKTIEESKISIVIFSKDYGSSKWCLQELVKIMELNKIKKQTVVPVFYRVEPFHVRYQTGSFEDSFVKHEKKFPDEVQKWREALKEASHLSGHNSSVTRPDTKLVTAIVDDIYKKLTGDENISSSSDFKGLIGLDERIKHVKSLLCLHETDVRIIGILGMGGIGKTTLVRVIFNQISSHQFEGVCFIQDVREKLENSGGLDHLQEDILSKVLKDRDLKLDGPGIIPPRIKKRLKQTKVFIVLDDVDDFIPLQILASGVELGQGSRIIVTSRDRLVLLNCEVDNQNIYEVKEFNYREALQLFCNRAFNQDQPTEDLRKLSNDIVNYAGGNPLALTVFGSSLRGSSLNQESKKKVWETTVDKLRTNFNSSISKKLEISYDGLEDEAKGVFLDIACFLKGRDRDYVASILDDCDRWLEDLIHKSLITVSHKTIQMHDLLQDMGRDIVRKQSPTDSGKRSRLWAPEDVQRTLKNNVGTSEVQGICLAMSNIKDMHLSPKTFKKMVNLRLLKFYKDYQNLQEFFTRSSHKVQFREGLNKASFAELRSFIWHGYPLKVPSSNFDPKNLIEFDLSMSNLERLWDDTTEAPKLRWLILRQCFRLTEIPNLSKSPLLERIDLYGCLSLTKIINLSKLPLLKEIILNGCSCLTEIPNLSESPLLERIDLLGCLSLTKIINLSKLPSLKEIILNGCSCLTEIPNLSESPLLERIDLNDCRSLLDFPPLAPRLSYLTSLNLKGCFCLRSFPSNIHFQSLSTLNLSDRINLTTFPQISGNIICLDMSRTAIEEVPPSIENLIKLSHLDLSECTRLKQISTNICKLKSLMLLNLENCSQLESFPEISEKMEGLGILILSGTAIKELPHSIENLVKLSHLNLSECTRLKHISTNICKLKSLKELNLQNCSQLESFPEILEKMEGLGILILSGTAIKELPHSIENLIKLYHLNLSKCTRLKQISTNICKLKSLMQLNLANCSQLEIFPEISEIMEDWGILILSGTAIKEPPHSIENLIKLFHLNLSERTRLKQISTNICKLKSLMLNVENCSQLESFPEILKKMKGLEILVLSGTAIKELPHSIENLTKLSKLYLRRCNNLESLPCSLCNLISLKCLYISDCPKLEILPDNFGNLKSLEDLSMDRIAISQLPSTMMHLNKTMKISCCGCRYLRFTDLLGLPCSLTRLDFNDCNLNKIPKDIGCLSSLVFLELSGNNFESLPKSMKQLYKLKSLKVDNCNMLQSLTDLPSALKYLSASGCKQLRSIPDASEFANLIEAEFIFTNCLNLKETAVGNMLATLKEGYEEGDEIGMLTFFCPGSKVPEWFMYRNEGSSIVECCELKFQMPWHDDSNGWPLLGFVVCTVIAYEKYCYIKGDSKCLCIEYKYCSDGDESSPNNITVVYRNIGSHIVFGFGNETLIDSDHIAFEFFKTSVPRVRESDFSNFFFRFSLTYQKNPNCRIKSFGVCPIYAKHNITLPSLKKQKTAMQTVDLFH